LTIRRIRWREVVLDRDGLVGPVLPHVCGGKSRLPNCDGDRLGGEAIGVAGRIWHARPFVWKEAPDYISLSGFQKEKYEINGRKSLFC
jgi:hypothetical protein